jgi:hypothetical protein
MIWITKAAYFDSWERQKLLFSKASAAAICPHNVGFKLEKNFLSSTTNRPGQKKN